MGNIKNVRDLHLFVKKDDADGKDFYYLGQMDVIDHSHQEKKMPNGDLVVTMDFKLRQAISFDFMRYFVEA